MAQHALKQESAEHGHAAPQGQPGSASHDPHTSPPIPENAGRLSLLAAWGSLPTVVAVALLAWYAFAFYQNVSPYWFHPGWTTDDATQQIYPFHEVATPGLFAGDIITDVMKGYLAPLHYWICYGVTWLTGDPIMMGHWVMLIQVVGAAGLLFAAVRGMAGSVAACAAVTWMLHSRNMMQRLTGGLPRGWSPAIFAAFLLCASRGSHRGMLCTIGAGILLNPPATLVVALAYGGLLVWRAVCGEQTQRRGYRRKLFNYALLAPFFALLTLTVIHRPAQIGQMVSLSVAEQMPEFARPEGRFPFLPFFPASEEIRRFGFEAFVNRFYRADPTFRQLVPALVGISLLVFAGIGAMRRRVTIPAEIAFFGLAALSVYFLSRIFAFWLYVPNRHLQIPMAIFFIVALTVGVWRALHCAGSGVADVRNTRIRPAWPSLLGLICLASFVVYGSGSGLYGDANFNYRRDKHGEVTAWLRENTPPQALVAGHPTHIDDVPLFAARRAYVTTEVAHPFYTRYYAEMKRRLEVVLRAHYSATLEELVALLEPEGVDYFVFKRAEFYPEVLEKATYYPPFQPLVKQLASRPQEQYAYRQLPVEVDRERFPFMPFKDRQSVVVDVKALRSFLDAQRSAARAARQLALLSRSKARHY